jgi:hypothetical protein
LQPLSRARGNNKESSARGAAQVDDGFLYLN